ncbi:hypothetical protein Misp01_58360 [Microtetraspora sp. NBRC 13810]|uniref:hypothetical protein n=1 Tax=Microtetraspora sp. NBRC 13810 TaxID=3030990 RepID=UPI0024A38F8B|nr:hypothetical protein [Microtetraspora sp. NBRC 13810]GLW10708.1 hypothetical protein Misp01_58360 [Microtetraspora sp. NBRC 13810]
MAGHELIAAQLAILADRLPAQAMEELADGLQEAYEAQLAKLHDPDVAARAAIDEFGDADTITAAFVRESPWRRMALKLLTTGPLMGAVWGLTLLSAQVWDWPIPLAVRIAYGAVLVGAALTLLTVVRAKHAYRRTRIATLVAATALITLDTSMLAAAMSMPSSAVWPLLVAISASLIRITATLRAMPAALTR